MSQRNVNNIIGNYILFNFNDRKIPTVINVLWRLLWLKETKKQKIFGEYLIILQSPTLPGAQFDIDRTHIYFYKLTLVLSILSFLFNFGAFCTPYWLISWPRFHTPFKRIGLWTVCFDGLSLKRDENMQSYYGCWWIFTTYFWRLRKTMFPPWFVIVQISSTISIILDIICIVLLSISRNSALKGTISSMYQYLFSIQLLNAISVLFNLLAIFLFGIYANNVTTWMPNQDISYLYISYASAVVSAIIGLFILIINFLFMFYIRNKPSLVPATEKALTTEL
ncbi:hypothetical protein A3Q56_02437 [Intoshia linei]|uniref:Uncharacterized protein n=1 Tax=Intoshia linei TaxID=1819745 RepID=A0A177B8B5_9BILA|nr:hypothetical protein A3Q56_02437 [Intoshia linei]